MSVNVTWLPGWEHHMHCHFHGVIVEALANGVLRVWLDGMDDDE